MSAAAAPRGRAIFGAVTFGSPKSRFEMTHTRYGGFETLRQAIADRDYTLPPGMTVTAPDDVALDPAATTTAFFDVRVPDDAQPGQRIPLNIRAQTTDGTLVGGVTVLFEVEP